MWSSVEQFPYEYVFVLLQCGLVAGVMSQNLFAVDTDMPNYSDQGNSFVIDHGTKLAAFLNQVTAQLDKMIPVMKLKFVRSGSLHIQAGPNYRMSTLLSAAPNGALFRNIYFKG